MLLPFIKRDPVPLQEKIRKQNTGGAAETILLVEDEAAIRDLFERTLTAHGYRVLAAGDGQEVLDRVAGYGEPIDLLVTDVVMPRLSGPELVRRLARQEPGLEVLYMSDYSQEEDLGALSAGECAAVVQKPFPPSRLRTEIRERLDER